MLSVSSAARAAVRRSLASGTRKAGVRTANGSAQRVVLCHKNVRFASASTATDVMARSMSSIAEPNPSLFSGKMQDLTGLDPSEQLRTDVRVMGSLLGKIITLKCGPEIFDKVEVMRALAKSWRDKGAGREPENAQEAAETFAELARFVSSLSSEELGLVGRAFTHFLAIANAAESHHRSRLIQQSMLQSASQGELAALPNKKDSCGGVIPTLLNNSGVPPEIIWKNICSQTVELVLTAHPTEVNRRTIIDKHKRVQKLLTEADACRAMGVVTPFQQMSLNDRMHREIGSLWQSDEVSRVKPTPVFEAERGTLVVETVLWEALPTYLRKLDATMRHTLGPEYGLPLDAQPIKISSWMGGDRDGNPNVTSNVTREVCLANRAKAARLFRQDLTSLSTQLSITNCSEELREFLGSDAREPYKEFLKPMIEKLQRTEDWATQGIASLKSGSAAYVDRVGTDDIYLSKDEIMEELLVIHRSLAMTGNPITANGALTDVIRNVSAFGLVMVPLDVRQESDRHTEALDAITKFLGLGSYAGWDEKTRINWLQQQLTSKRPLLRPGEWKNHPDIFSPTAVDTLETFAMIAEQHEDSLNAYVISQATSASDVMAVVALQRDAGVKKPLRVAPLFETLEDLEGGAATMETLFNTPAYVGAIGGKQEVMIGYSDSAKDAGRLAASWAQYETQEELAAVAKKYKIDMTFFHGKGGTVGRGGNPATFNAIMAHAPDTINGQFRVTEQGEMINQNFGYHDRAERTMDIFTSAVLAEALTERQKPLPEWRTMMATLSKISCDAYRKIVREDERFVPYFRSATPELELSNLNIGSRPAKRKAGGGVESLRAIPWIFAWTQTRLNLPTWLGVGEAVGDVLKSEDADVLRDMYENWGSFRTTIDLVEMVLAKSEPSVAAHYDKMLVHDEMAKELGAEVRGIHAGTENAILDLTNHTTLAEHNTLLRRTLHVRNPYVDCLNVLQAETLLRLRACEDPTEKKELMNILITSITGIANGMGNTG